MFWPRDTVRWRRSLYVPLFSLFSLVFPLPFPLVFFSPFPLVFFSPLPLFSFFYIFPLFSFLSFSLVFFFAFTLILHLFYFHWIPNIKFFPFRFRKLTIYLMYFWFNFWYLTAGIWSFCHLAYTLHLYVIHTPIAFYEVISFPPTNQGQILDWSPI